jgi:hypothetical protein
VKERTAAKAFLNSEHYAALKRRSSTSLSAFVKVRDEAKSRSKSKVSPKQTPNQRQRA